jgi:hypothetical protein
MVPTLAITQGVDNVTPGDATTGSTETVDVTFKALAAGDTFTLAGRILTALLPASALEVAAVFASGTATSKVSVGGSLSGYNAAPTVTPDDHNLLTSTATGDTRNVSDLTVSSYSANSTFTVVVTPGAAGSAASGNYYEASAAVNNLTTLLTDADSKLTGTVKYYVGQVTAGDTYVVTDYDGNGYTDVIQLVGVALSGIVAADIAAS